jgi:hypothetical protein
MPRVLDPVQFVINCRGWMNHRQPLSKTGEASLFLPNYD